MGQGQPDALSAGPPTTVPDRPAPILAPEGWPIIAIFVLSAAVLTWLASWTIGHALAWAVGAVTGLLSLWCIWFFRDPQRRIPAPCDGREPIVSPADGVICDIRPASPPPELEVPFDQASRMTRVSVFMNVFNVHVNRAPIACTVLKTAYVPGKFFNASFDKASEHNERMGLRLRIGSSGTPTALPREMACVQIAGLVARRIVCRVKEGAILATGERFGIIRFGSRVDVYLPEGVTPSVRVGDRTIAGQTILGWLEVAAPSPVAPGSHTNGAARRPPSSQPRSGVR